MGVYSLSLIRSCEPFFSLVQNCSSFLVLLPCLRLACCSAAALEISVMSWVAQSLVPAGTHKMLSTSHLQMVDSRNCSNGMLRGRYKGVLTYTGLWSKHGLKAQPSLHTQTHTHIHTHIHTVKWIDNIEDADGSWNIRVFHSFPENRGHYKREHVIFNQQETCPGGWWGRHT